MITHFEATVSLISALTGIVSVLTVGVWRLRGTLDRLDATDRALTDAIRSLHDRQAEQHADNQRRFTAIERRLAARPSAPR